MTALQFTRPVASRPPAERSRRGRLPRWERVLLVCLAVATSVLLVLTLAAEVPRARADSVAYLIDVTVGPGYSFANAQDALAYGEQLCDKVSGGCGYTDLIGDVKSDFRTSDEFQASYLIDKAVNELCPAQIWQLRNSAAHYLPPAG
jgi:Protein of unknown function (DUF732)